MSKLRMLFLVVVPHWMVAIVHLFIAAVALPAPNDHVSGLAVTLITSGHLVVALAVWKLGDWLAGSVSLVFFLAAMCADLYEHFRLASSNSVFGVAGDWAVWFNVSVFSLLGLEILGCALGVTLLGGRTGNNRPNRKANPSLLSQH